MFIIDEFSTGKVSMSLAEIGLQRLLLMGILATVLDSISKHTRSMKHET